MLYASIALVVAGLVLIAYSFAARNRHRHFAMGHGEMIPDPPPEAASKPIHPEMVTDAPESGTGKNTEKPMKQAPAREKETVVRVENKSETVVKSPRSPEPRPVGVVQPAEKHPEQAEKMSASAMDDEGEEKDSAVLYADSSGVVDYESGANTIDPTFKKYSKLRRIGKGKVGIIKDGLNFQLRKKLFRFDYYRIQRMVAGKNYLALFIKGSDEVRLLIFEGDGTSLRRIINDFNSFRKRSM